MGTSDRSAPFDKCGQQILDTAGMELAVRVLHKAFELEYEPE
jgi:hypothetical protein